MRSYNSSTSKSTATLVHALELGVPENTAAAAQSCTLYIGIRIPMEHVHIEHNCLLCCRVQATT